MTVQMKGVPKVPVIAIKPNTSLYQVYFSEGGILPTSLKGLFTSAKDAQKAVDLWESNKKPLKDKR